MENNTDPFNNLPYGWVSALPITTGAAGDPYLAAGLLLGHCWMGLAYYIWTFWSQHSRLKGYIGSLRSAQNIHNGFQTMFLMDIVNAIASVIMAIEFVASTCTPSGTCVYALFAWFLSRWFGLILHLSNALVGLLFLCHPQWRDKLRYLSVFAVVVVIGFIPVYVSPVAIFGLGVVTIGLVLAIIKCSVSPVPPSAADQKKSIVFVAMMTFLFIYIPVFVLQCLVIGAANRGEPTDKHLTIYVNALFLTSFQPLMNGCLTYVVLKLPFEEEQQQQQQHEMQHQPQSLENPNCCISENVTTCTKL